MTEPLRKEAFARCPVEHAFRVFTSRTDLWWPVHHRRDAAATVHMEPGLGGRLVEVGAAGEERILGTLVRWEPPSALALAWTLGAPPGVTTHVEIRFRAVDGGTRVEVVHSDAPRALGDAWGQRVALFDRGWTAVLDALVRAAQDEDPA